MLADEYGKRNQAVRCRIDPLDGPGTLLLEDRGSTPRQGFMTEWTTIRVKQDAKDRAEDLKDDQTTWSEWVADEARAPEVPTDDIADAVVDDLRASLPADVADEVAARLR